MIFLSLYFASVKFRDNAARNLVLAKFIISDNKVDLARVEVSR